MNGLHDRLNIWRQFLGHLMALGIFGLIPIVIIHIGKLVIQCGVEAEPCIVVDDNFPAGITYGELLSAASIYMTLVISALLGRFALFLYEAEKANIVQPVYTRMQKWVTVIVSVAVIATYVAVVSTLTVDMQSWFLWLVLWTAKVFYILPLALGVGFCVVTVTTVVQYRRSI